MEININNNKKVIALYLPQFHTIPENDEWWGKGFTEWTNTKKAKPLFEGHEQPKTPFNEDYYDLSDVTVMERQAALAKSYGIFGFCYYHYWFKNGKKLLEKPVEQMLADQKVDIPFCLCWANENWSRNWDGGNREIIMAQDYGGYDDWKQHFEYLLQFFKDERYITFNGMPVLVVYRPGEIDQFNKMRDCFEQMAIEAGLKGLIIAAQVPAAYFERDEKKLNIDYYIKFEPDMGAEFYHIKKEIDRLKQEHGVGRRVKDGIKSALTAVHAQKLIKSIQSFKANLYAKPDTLTVFDYDDIWNSILNDAPYGEDLINGGFTAWDNTARNVCGRVIQGSAPEKFGHYMKQLLQKESAMNLVFVNAWNEWAEGAYLEPDELHGYGYLEALHKALSETENSNNSHPS